jgi:hypothetical protein
MRVPAVLVVSENFKVLIGIGLTWACVFIFFNGMTHASLDGWAFVFPVFQPTNLLVLISAPVAQSAFYILARKTSWLLNTYLAISVVCCAVAWLHLTKDRYTDVGYRYTYWHQGDLLCVSDGCNDILFFSYLILMQGLILVFVPSVFKEFPFSFRWVPRVIAIAVLLWLVLTSFALTISM